MVRVLTFSEAGGHPDNEDAFAAGHHPLAPDLWLGFIADGQGGRAGGGLAARLACETMFKTAGECPAEKLTKPAMWTELFRRTDAVVANDKAAGFTTLVGLCVRQGRIVGASVGDSAVVRFNRKGSHELTEGQPKNPPIGSGDAVAVPFAAETGDGWQLLLMTDGVWKYVGWDRIYDAARRCRGADLVAELQRAARLPKTGAFQDDFTVLVADDFITESSPKRGT